MHEREFTKAVLQLTQAVTSLHAWLQASAGAPTKRELKEMEERLLKAMGERVDPAQVIKLARASDKLEQTIESNQPKLSGQ